MFSGTHVCYLQGYRRAGVGRALLTQPLIPAAGLVSYLLVASCLWRRLGDLRWPVSGYGMLLFGMVAAACATSRATGAGAILFALSDFMIGLRLAGVRFRAQRAVIAVTYIAGQLAISRGWPSASPPSKPAVRRRGLRGR